MSLFMHIECFLAFNKAYLNHHRLKPVGLRLSAEADWG
jgi:hypothetical protein